MTVKIELTRDQLERILDALDYQFDMTENAEENDLNKALAVEIVSQWDNQEK